jgi:hypothetical protein
MMISSRQFDAWIWFEETEAVAARPVHAQAPTKPTRLVFRPFLAPEALFRFVAVLIIAVL